MMLRSQASVPLFCNSLTLAWCLQLIRGGFEGVFGLIMRLLGFKRRPAITLEDPSEKYPLRLIDKEVSVVLWNKQFNSWSISVTNHSNCFIFRLLVMTPESFALPWRPQIMCWDFLLVSLINMLRSRHAHWHVRPTFSFFFHSILISETLL